MSHRNITFCIFSDLHCSEESSIYKELTQNISSQTATNEIEFVVNLGDSIGVIEDETGALKVMNNITEALDKLPIEKYYVTGNHDLEYMTKSEFSNTIPLPGKELYYSFDHGPLHFIVLDMNYHEDGSSYANGNFKWFNSFLPEEELLWLKNDLKQNVDLQTFIFTHQNIDDRNHDSGHHPEIISNADEVRRILEDSGNVIAVFQGHGHRTYQKCINGIEYISIPSSVEKPVFNIVSYTSGTLEISEPVL